MKKRSFLRKYSKEIITLTWATLISALITLIICFFMGESMFANVSSFLQYVTVILALLAWNNTRKLLEDREKMHLTATNKDMILTISLANDVQADVNAYLSHLNGDEASLRELKPIEFTINSKDNIIAPNSKYMDLVVNENISGTLSITGKKDMPADENISDYISEFQSCIKRVFDIMSENATERLHVFIAAPVGMAAYITPYFSNKKTVIMYRYIKDLPQKYIQMGPVENRG